ncbi:rna-directed dna polymerase from mobile element jockey-like [Pitangus sulphuratus]|nr:rna-directed dna polymerase from mobile element jockey-like [Pitangus sulphuratus]
MHPRILRELAEEVTKLLSVIYQQSWPTREVPGYKKLANATVIYKKGWKEDPGNDRPVSLTESWSILNPITHHVEDNEGIRPRQHGFEKAGWLDQLDLLRQGDLPSE